MAEIVFSTYKMNGEDDGKGQQWRKPAGEENERDGFGKHHSDAKLGGYRVRLESLSLHQEFISFCEGMGQARWVQVLVWDPNYSHLKELPSTIKLCEQSLVSSDPIITTLGKGSRLMCSPLDKEPMQLS
ncbi:hypothetical protein Vadar_011124 [Vaccinium darrowii]|uniref:Uncharacterized protein n=1 Tax=Vaccinium darrowii TaxID=229202 RepID=A0ACB7WZQ8_9ERIC|nr:hypothetical protein Vadar_011124 [Vaccinium darrowii]